MNTVNLERSKSYDPHRFSGLDRPASIRLKRLLLVDNIVNCLNCCRKFVEERGIDSGLPWPSPCGRLPGLSCPVTEPWCFAPRPLSDQSLRQIPKRPRHWRSLFGIWRRERDSNPRYAINVYTLSRRAPSATRTPLRNRSPFYQVSACQSC